MSEQTPPSIESISAVTLGVHDLERSVSFYEQLGFALRHRSETFATFHVGASYLNLVARETSGWWGRVILYVSDVDAMHERALALGLTPEFAPRDAPWGERYFHLLDPDGHELSFARPLGR